MSEWPEEWYGYGITDTDLAYLYAVADNFTGFLTDNMLKEIDSTLYRKSENHDKEEENDSSFWTTDKSVADMFDGIIRTIDYKGKAWLVSEYLDSNHARLAKIKHELCNDSNMWELEELVATGLAYNSSEKGSVVVPNKYLNREDMSIAGKIGNPKYMTLKQLENIANDPYFRGVDGKDYDVIREEIEERLWKLQNDKMNKDTEKRIKEMEEYEEILKATGAKMSHIKKLEAAGIKVKNGKISQADMGRALNIIAGITKADMPEVMLEGKEPNKALKKLIVDEGKSDKTIKELTNTKPVLKEGLKFLHADPKVDEVLPELLVDAVNPIKKVDFYEAKAAMVFTKEDGFKGAGVYLVRNIDGPELMDGPFSSLEEATDFRDDFNKSGYGHNDKDVIRAVRLNSEGAKASLVANKAVAVDSAEEDKWYCVKELGQLVDAFNAESKIIKLKIIERRGVFCIPDADKFMHEGYKDGNHVYIHPSKETDKFIELEAKKLGCSVKYNNVGSCFWLSKISESSVSKAKINPTILSEIEKLELALRKSEKLSEKEKNDIKMKLSDLSKVLDIPEQAAAGKSGLIGSMLSILENKKNQVTAEKGPLIVQFQHWSQGAKGWECTSNYKMSVGLTAKKLDEFLTKKGFVFMVESKGEDGIPTRAYKAHEMFISKMQDQLDDIAEETNLETDLVIGFVL